MSENDMTAAEYRDEIEALANNVIDEIIEWGEWPIDSDRFEEAVSEEVWTTADSHSWMIYYAYHMDVLRHAEADPDEWQMYVDLRESPSYRDVIQAMAFDVFQADLYRATFDELEARREEAE